MTITPETLQATIAEAVATALKPPPPHFVDHGQPIDRPTGAASYTRKTAFGCFQEMVTSGMDVAEATEILKRDGFEGFAIGQGTPQQVRDQATAESIAPTRANYEFDLNAHGRAAALDERLPEGAAKFVESAKAWCAALQLPPGEGANLIEMIVDDGLRRERMTISEATADAHENARLLEYFASRKGISVEELVAKAVKVASMASPLAADSTALRNAYVVNTLAMHGASLEYANKLRGKS